MTTCSRPFIAVIALFGALGMAACAGPTPPQEGATPLPYSENASAGYGDLADDPPGDNATHFRQHSYVAATGDTHGPDTVGSRRVGDRSSEAAAALARLYRAFDAGARTRQPQIAAEAQVAFDCWLAAVEAQDAEQARACRGRFDKAVAALGERSAATTLVLLANPDGTVGEVALRRSGETTGVAQAGAGVAADDDGVRRLNMDAAEIDRVFGETLAALPQPPSNYVLYFETGRTELADRSEAKFEEVVDDVGRRAIPELRLEGHADRVGSDVDNEALSRARARAVAQRVASATGVDASEMRIVYFGEQRPAIRTPDGTPEPRNRRVEVNVR